MALISSYCSSSSTHLRDFALARTKYREKRKKWTPRTLEGDKSSLVFIIEVEHGLQLHIVQLTAAAATLHGGLELGESELS